VLPGNTARAMGAAGLFAQGHPPGLNLFDRSNRMKHAAVVSTPARPSEVSSGEILDAPRARKGEHSGLRSRPCAAPKDARPPTGRDCILRASPIRTFGRAAL